MKKVLLVLVVAALAAPGFSQARAAFLDVDAIDDIFVTPSNGGLTYFVELGANPSFDFAGTTYEITDVFGFFVLSNDGDFVANHDPIGNWQTRLNNGGVGGVAGWFIPPGASNGLNPGESFTFTFNSLNVAEVDQYGYHVRLNGTFNGENTLHITIPEPTTVAALGIALAGLAARRRRRG